MKSKLKWLALALVPGLALAAAFPLFQPANGVLKGSTSTYVTTAATSADIRGLWSGTCDLTTFLRGDGACAQVSLTTNVSGILPVPNGGSGVGTLTGVLHGNGTGVFTASNVVLTTEVTGILPVANGGTNLSASADDNIMIGNGTTWQTKAVPTCTDTAGNHLNYDASTNTVSCGTSAPGGLTGFANPTGSIGLTAVNGVATTAERSDSTHALSQSIAPTWTATHTFNASNTQQVLQNTSAGANAKNTVERISTAGTWAISSASDAAPSTAVTDLIAGSRTGTAWGTITLGNTSDVPALNFVGTPTFSRGGTAPNGSVNAGAGAAALFEFSGNGNTSGTTSMSVGQDAAGGGQLINRLSGGALSLGCVGTCTTSIATTTFTVASVNLTPTAGSFTVTFDDACTTSPTATFTYLKIGTVVNLSVTAASGFACTGDSANFASTGAPIPAAIRPTNNTADFKIMAGYTDNGVASAGVINFTSAGNVAFSRVTGGTTVTTWTAAGSRNMPSSQMSGFSYLTNN